MDSVTQPLELLAQQVTHVAYATARSDNFFREIFYQNRVMPYLQMLSAAELDRSHRFCGYLPLVGWQVLNKTLGLVNGADPLEFERSRPYKLYEPRTNYGGWIRIFRLEAAKFPQDPEILDHLVEVHLQNASQNRDLEEQTKGLLGLNPVFPIDRRELRDAILRSDLFTAPWMVAMWKPDTSWVVWGTASRYVQGDLPDEDPAVKDLFTRPRADQTFGFDEQGRALWGTGPQTGIQVVIDAVNYALSNGYYLDLILEPFQHPVESWEDGVSSISESPIMGVLIHTLATSWLTSLVQDPQGGWRLSSISPYDEQLFLEATGLDVTKPLKDTDLELLVSAGIPVYGRIPGFVPKGILKTVTQQHKP